MAELAIDSEYRADFSQDYPVKLVVAVQRELSQAVWRTFLGSLPNVTVADVVGSRDDLLRAVAETSPNVVAVWPNPPDLDPATIARDLNREEPGSVPLLFLTGTLSWDWGGSVIRALAYAPVGWITTRTPVPVLLWTLRLLTNKMTVLGHEASRWISSQPYPSIQGDLASLGLTPKESEVLLLLAQGLDNQEITDRLHISVRTLEVHLSRLTTKLAARSRSDLIVKALHLTMGHTGKD